MKDSDNLFNLAGSAIDIRQVVLKLNKNSELSCPLTSYVKIVENYY